MDTACSPYRAGLGPQEPFITDQKVLAKWHLSRISPFRAKGNSQA